MLQAVLRSLGESQSDSPGCVGTPVEIDGGFGTGTNKAVNRLRYQDEIGSKGDVDNNTPTTVDNGVLTKIGEHWDDYLKAFEAYPVFPYIKPSPDPNAPNTQMIQNEYQNTWLPEGAEELAQFYTDNFATNFATQVQNCHTPEACHEARKNLLDAWVIQEAEAGHWGYKYGNIPNVPFSIVLGGWAENGPIGFPQIQTRHKYGINTSGHKIFTNVNLYHPVDAIKGFAIFSNNRRIGGGGGFWYAFAESPSRYQQTCDYSQHPHHAHIGASYTDDVTDLLSKGIMAHHSGAGTFLPPQNNNSSCLSENNDGTRAKICPWPELLREVIPPDANTPKDNANKIRNGINYVLSAKRRAGIPLRSWTWTAQRIVSTTGSGTCQITAAAGDEQVVESGAPVTAVNQILISPGGDGVLNTNLTPEQLQQAGAQVEEFSFTYSEEDWWYDSRNETGTHKQGILWATKFAQEAQIRQGN